MVKLDLTYKILQDLFILMKFPTSPPPPHLFDAAIWNVNFLIVHRFDYIILEFNK